MWGQRADHTDAAAITLTPKQPKRTMTILLLYLLPNRENERQSLSKRYSGTERMSDNDQPELARLTVELLSAYFANNNVPSSELPGLIEATKTALRSAPAPEGEVVETFVAAVTIEESLASPQHILSMIDGKGYKTLKRHLSNNGLTPEQYKTRYNLPADYPLVAPDYSVLRRNFAKKLGLGGRPVDEAATPAIIAKSPAATKPAKATAVAPPVKTAPKATRAAAARTTVKKVPAAAPKKAPTVVSATPAPSVTAPAAAPASPAADNAKKPRRMARPASNTAKVAPTKVTTAKAASKTKNAKPSTQPKATTAKAEKSTPTKAAKSVPASQAPKPVKAKPAVKTPADTPPTTTN